jgi:predicted DNA-binding protein YlxM (UPF0122 family)
VLFNFIESDIKFSDNTDKFEQLMSSHTASIFNVYKKADLIVSLVEKRSQLKLSKDSLSEKLKQSKKHLSEKF